MKWTTKGRFIIPGQFRKDGKPFVGDTFEETKVLESEQANPDGNRHARRRAAALERQLKALKEAL